MLHVSIHPLIEPKTYRLDLWLSTSFILLEQRMSEIGICEYRLLVTEVNRGEYEIRPQFQSFCDILLFVQTFVYCSTTG